MTEFVSRLVFCVWNMENKLDLFLFIYQIASPNEFPLRPFITCIVGYYYLCCIVKHISNNTHDKPVEKYKAYFCA